MEKDTFAISYFFHLLFHTFSHGMTASIKVLTASTIDSSPSILLISPNGARTLINCGEGCQRSFLESTSDKVRSVNQICLTHIGHSATGGLPGLILTSADAAESSSLAASQPPSENNANVTGAKKKKKRNNVSEVVGKLDIIGPVGTKKFIHSLRHFMRRDNFHLNISEGKFQSKAKVGDGVVNTTRKGKKRKKNNGNVAGNNNNNGTRDDFEIQNNDFQQKVGLFGVETIPMKRKIHKLVKSSTPSTETEKYYQEEEIIDIASFVFTTSPIPGKFQVQKAKQLQIPPGPQYAELKAGRTIQFPHPNIPGEKITVQPHQVLEGGSDGVAVALIYCPDEYAFDQIYNNADVNNIDNSSGNAFECLFRFKKSRQRNEGVNNRVVLEVMIHYTPVSIFRTDKYQTWMNEFESDVQHITIHPMEDLSCNGGNEETDGSPFRSAVLGAMTRALVHKEIYASPFPTYGKNEIVNDNEVTNSEESTTLDMIVEEDNTKLKIIRARPQMEYTLIPLAKKGLNASSVPSINDKFGISTKEHKDMISLANDSGAVREAQTILDEPLNKSLDKNVFHSGELIFTGTGSAIPCKHRNVTGMYLQMKNGNGILLDVGEGTIGQLIRVWKSNIPHDDDQDNYIRKQLLGIKALWISHPHADHHLGIVRFLSERNALLKGCTTMDEISTDHQLVIIAPTSFLSFLNEYNEVDPMTAGAHLLFNCEDTLPNKMNPFGERLNRSLRITSCVSVRVSHCRDSYAVVLDCNSFGRIVYSGDCRPSDRLVDIGSGADLLIHEATFEDGMEEEAVLKRHSTVGEAIAVGKRMKTKGLILTHFSQRYPRIPPLQKDGESLPFPIAVAFDFMKVNPGNIVTAFKLTPALRLLYPETDDNDAPLDTKPSAKEILSIPGAFAKSITRCNQSEN